jgi:hypothetical protein
MEDVGGEGHARFFAASAAVASFQQFENIHEGIEWGHKRVSLISNKYPPYLMSIIVNPIVFAIPQMGDGVIF